MIAPAWFAPAAMVDGAAMAAASRGNDSDDPHAGDAPAAAGGGDAAADIGNGGAAAALDDENDAPAADDGAEPAAAAVAGPGRIHSPAQQGM